jgi:hypothetical protein
MERILNNKRLNSQPKLTTPEKKAKTDNTNNFFQISPLAYNIHRISLQSKSSIIISPKNPASLASNVISKS